MNIYDLNHRDNIDSEERKPLICWYILSVIIQIIYLAGTILWDWVSISENRIALAESFFPGWLILLIYISHLIVIQMYLFKFEKIAVVGLFYYILSAVLLFVRAGLIGSSDEPVIKLISLTNIMFAGVLVFKRYQIIKDGEL